MERGGRSRLFAPSPVSEAERAEYAEELSAKRPRSRTECDAGPRPCPWIGCRFHLYLNVHHNGKIRLTFPDTNPWDLAETCALDVAETGSGTLDCIAEVLNLTRERVRQIESRALITLSHRAPDLRFALDEAPVQTVLPSIFSVLVPSNGSTPLDADDKVFSKSIEERPPTCQKPRCERTVHRTKKKSDRIRLGEWNRYCPRCLQVQAKRRQRRSQSL